MENKFKIQIWKVRKYHNWDSDKTEYTTSKVETYISDNLPDILHWLRLLGVTYKSVNKFEQGTFSKRLFSQMTWTNTIVFANIYMKNSPVKVSEYHGGKNMPDFTACGYRECNKRKYRRKNHYKKRNYKHRFISLKETTYMQVEISEINACKYNVPIHYLNSTRNQSNIGEGYRSRKCRSWKNIKKRHQWQ